MRKVADFPKGSMVRVTVVANDKDFYLEGIVDMVFWKKNNQNTIDPYLKVNVLKNTGNPDVIGHSMDVELNKPFFDYDQRLVVVNQ